MKKRKARRYPINISFQISQDLNHPIDIHTVDFSTNGLCFLWVEPLEVNTHVKVKIPLEEITKLDTHARVVYSKQDLETGLFQTGLEFDDKSKDFHNIIASKLKEISAEDESMMKDAKWETEFLVEEEI